MRILAIGDSFTYGWGVDIEYTWPFLLEKKLSGQYKDKRVEVINLGVGGAVPSEYSEIAEEYILLYKPDFVIVGFVEGNDFAQITTSVEKGKKVISSETTLSPYALTYILNGSPTGVLRPVAEYLCLEASNNFYYCRYDR